MQENDPAQDKAGPADAVILIHGMDGRQPGDVLGKLERGICASKRSLRAVGEDVDNSGHPGRRITWVPVEETGTERRLDLFEAYWGDVVDDLSKKNIRTQVSRGMFLILYWMSTPVMKARNRYIAIGGGLTAMGLILWWYGVAISLLNVAVLAAIDQTPGQWLTAVSETSSTATWLLCALSGVTAWWVGLLAMGFSGLLAPLIESSVDILHFVQKYLGSENLRQRIWKRVSSLVFDLSRSGQYRRITLVSHSFGVAIHVNWMADYQGYSKVPLRHITLGGPLAVLAFRSRVVKHALLAAHRNPHVRGAPWTDFYAPHDWMCTAIPDASEEHSFNDPEFRATGHVVDSERTDFSETSLWKRLAGVHHTQYFNVPRVIDRIMGD